MKRALRCLGILLFGGVAASAQNYNTGQVTGLVGYQQPAGSGCQQSPAITGVPVIAVHNGKPSLTTVKKGRFDFPSLQVVSDEYDFSIRLKGYKQVSRNRASPHANQAVSVVEPVVCLDRVSTSGAATNVARRLSPWGSFLIPASFGGSAASFPQLPADPPGNPKSIFGSVKDETGKPARARLTLFALPEDLSGLIRLASVDSSKDGGFEFRLDSSAGAASSYLLSAKNARVGSGFAQITPDEAGEPLSLVLQPPAPATPSPVAIESNSATRRGVFRGKTIEALPFYGSRTFDSLALLLPGVTPAPPNAGTNGPGISAGVGSAGQFSVNGLRSRENNFVVDGADNNDEEVGVRRQGFVILAPQTIESTLEFQVITALADARFGRAMGAQVNALSASGRNALHGTAYGFFSDRRANARNYFDMKPDPGQHLLESGGAPVLIDDKNYFLDNPVQREPPSSRTQAGFALGGPLSRSLDPQTFFFVAYEHQRTREQRQANFAVPTAGQRFGYVPQGEKEPVDQQEDLPCPRIPANSSDCLPFFGGFGSQGTRKAISAGYASSLFPFPNNPRGPYGGNTYTAVLPADGDGDLFSARVDRNLELGGTSHVLTARYNLTDEDSILPVTDSAIYSSLRPLVRIHNIATFFNTTFSPTVLNTFRFGWGRTSYDFFTAVRDPSLVSSHAPEFMQIWGMNESQQITWETDVLTIPDEPFLLNRPMLLAKAETSGASPSFKTGCRNGWQCDKPHLKTTQSIVGPVGRVNFAGFSPMGVDPAHFPQRRANNTGQLADTLTFVKGRHQLAVGFEFWRFSLNSEVQRNFHPTLDYFLEDENGLSALEAFDKGVYHATFAVQHDSTLDLIRNQLDFFVQDGIRVAPNLKATIGLRFSLNKLPSSADGRFEEDYSKAALELKSVDATKACEEAPPPVCFPTFVPCPTVINQCSKIVDGFRKAFPPTFLDAFGVSSSTVDGRFGLAWSPGGSAKTSIRAGWGIYTGQFPAILLDEVRNTFPRTMGLRYQKFPFDPGILRGDLTLNPRDNVVQLLPSNHFWPSDWDLDVFQPGKLQIPRAMQFAATVEREIFRGTVASLGYVGTRADNLLRANHTLEGLDLTRVRLSRNTLESTATSSYHSLQADLRGAQQRLGLNYGAAFTWSHSIDDASDFFELAAGPALPQNGEQPSERGSSSFDVRLRFVSHFVWELPFATRSWLLRDWRLSGILSAQSGVPFTVNTGQDRNGDWVLNDRLNSTAGLLGPDPADRRVRLGLPTSIDPNTLLAEEGAHGTGGRNTFRAAGFSTVDLSFGRKFSLAEGRHLWLRMEGFNVFNRPNFGIPVRILESPSFGSSVNTSTPNRRLQIALKLHF